MDHRDDDDDDDESFAKWMSSFWGHSWRDKDERGLRDHHRPHEASYRKASLPCPSWPLVLDHDLVCSSLEKTISAVACSSFPAFPNIASADCHPRRHSHEDQGSRSHLPMQYHRKCSVDGSLKEPMGLQRGAHSRMQEFSESLEKHLCLRTKHTPSSGPKGRKERDERHCLGTDVSSHKTLEHRGNSMKEARGDAAMAPLVEKGPE